MIPPFKIILKGGTNPLRLPIKHQPGFQKIIQVAIEHGIRLGGLEVGAVVLYPAVVEDVGTNLASPFVFHLLGFQLVLLRALPFEFDLVEAGLQHLHRLVAVQMLGTFFLARHHYPTGQMPEPNGRFCLVDVLSARAARTKSIPFYIRRIDFNLNGIVHHRVHRDGGKGGHPLALGIVRADAHQAVDPVFTFEQAVGEVAFDFQGNGFYPCHITILAVQFRIFKPTFLGPHQVHAVEHLGPVAGFGAASAGIDL